MSNEAINKYLTEAMGGCWHDNTEIQSAHTICKDCPISYLTVYWPDYRNRMRNDFFTWQGYGKLRDFYDSWDEDRQLLFIGFIVEKDNKECDGIIMPYYLAYLHAFHRDNLASLMVAFLKEEK